VNLKKNFEVTSFKTQQCDSLVLEYQLNGTWI